TVELLRRDAVVGVKAKVTAGGRIAQLGITCALCHSTVDNAVAPGVGRRLDGWPNRDLNVGAIVALSPVLDAATKAVLQSWGPGRCRAGQGGVQPGRALRELSHPADLHRCAAAPHARGDRIGPRARGTGHDGALSHDAAARCVAAPTVLPRRQRRDPYRRGGPLQHDLAAGADSAAAGGSGAVLEEPLRA